MAQRTSVSCGVAKRRFFLIGSDYVFPRTANHIVARHLRATYPDTELVGALYVPFGHKDFEDALRSIRASDADAVINTINGDSNIAFYNALAAAGIRADTLPVLATSIGEDELRSLLPQAVSGHLAASHYFQSVNTPSNRDFVARTQHLHRYSRVGRIRPDRQFDVVWQAPRMLAPDPFPQDAFPGWRCDWTAGGLTRGEPVALGL